MDRQLRILQRNAYAPDATKSDIELYIRHLERRCEIAPPLADERPPARGTWGYLRSEILKLPEEVMEDYIYSRNASNNDDIEQLFFEKLNAEEVENFNEVHGSSYDEGHPMFYH